MGMVWQAVDDLLLRKRLRHRLRAAWSVEIDEELAQAVERCWGRDKRAALKLRVRRAAADVWHLFAQRGAKLRKVVESVPWGGILLV
eukprot:13723959-Alexandrium_andersonii.AAC.1